MAAFTVVVAIGCSGQLPAAQPTDEPFPTEDIPTDEPEDTFENEPTLPPQPTADSGLLDFGNGLPTNVSTLLDSGIFVTEFADGAFSGSGASRSCGGTFVYPRGFSFSFPGASPAGDIEDVTFEAAELVPGTSTGAFGVSVSISSAAAGTRAITGLNTLDGDTGMAKLTVDGDGARKLVIDASGEGGVSVHLEVTCGGAQG